MRKEPHECPRRDNVLVTLASVLGQVSALGVIARCGFEGLSRTNAKDFLFGRLSAHNVLEDAT